MPLTKNVGEHPTEGVPIKVLHVDDEQGFLKASKQILETKGDYEVDLASSVEEALEKIKDQTFDIIVSDYQMPGKDGLQFLKELRGRGDNIPFIIFTGKGREEVAIQALNLGADHYINKVGDPETVYFELTHGINQVVDRARILVELSRSEERFRSLIESATAGVCVLDLRGCFTYVNKALADMVGFSVSEMIGQRFTDFLPREDKIVASQRFNKEALLGVEIEPFDFQITRRDGRTIHLASKPTGLYVNGKLVAFQAIIVDITEHKRAKEEVEKADQLWSLTFDAISDLVLIIDKNHVIVKANKAFSEFAGCKTEDLIGKHCFEVVHGTEEPWSNCPHTQALAIGKPVTEEVNDPNIGTPLLITNSPIFDENGEILGCVHIAKDVSQLKKAEKERNQKANDLILINSLNNAINRGDDFHDIIK